MNFSTDREYATGLVVLQFATLRCFLSDLT